MAHTPFANTEKEGMTVYIDKFQAYITVLVTIAPENYIDFRMKGMLFFTIKNFSGVKHLIQKCREDVGMICAHTVTYLK